MMEESNIKYITQMNQKLSKFCSKNIRFEGLGAEFALGRLAITEIDEFRMDKIGLKRFTA